MRIVRFITNSNRYQLLSIVLGPMTVLNVDHQNLSIRSLKSRKTVTVHRQKVHITMRIEEMTRGELMGVITRNELGPLSDLWSAPIEQLRALVEDWVHDLIDASGAWDEALDYGHNE